MTFEQISQAPLLGRHGNRLAQLRDHGRTSIAGRYHGGPPIARGVAPPVAMPAE